MAPTSEAGERRPGESRWGFYFGWVRAAYDVTMEAARRNGDAEKVEDRIREMVRSESSGERYLSKVLGSNLVLQ